jgi:hypothetical protein
MMQKFVVTMVSQATREWGSCARQASRMASEMESATLSGCPLVTHSEVKSLFSILFFLSFYKLYLKKKNRTPKIRCALLSNPHLSFAAGFGTLCKQVAGFHRAVPSTTLDKACMQFNTVFYTIF